MKKELDILEQKRLALQAKLDGEKTQRERNQLGQFATPTKLAEDVLAFVTKLIAPRENVRFLDPAIGTGSFYSALRKAVPEPRIADALGFEIDPYYAKPAAKLWAHSNLKLRVGDFTKTKPTGRHNLVVCNPPYVRHHHLGNGDKARLQGTTFVASGMKLSGLAGLYCHFMGLTDAWMADDGVAAWLVPSEFMDVNYGQEMKRYLLNRVTLLRIHRFDPNDVQFADALVSSAVVVFRKAHPPAGHAPTFTFGGTLASPHLSRKIPASALADERKWTRFPAAKVRTISDTPTLSDFFHIKRGIATGDNGYFILTREEVVRRHLPMDLLTPVLPSPRYLATNEIESDAHGFPAVEPQLFLLDTKLSEEEIERRSPELYAYLVEGKERGLHERYLCQHRSPWYAQEYRPAAPIVCTYLGRTTVNRSAPFRFILNRSRATVANVYLAMYPRTILEEGMRRDPVLIERIWGALNRLTPEQILGEGRVYGGGLHKLEPRELANVAVPEIADLVAPHGHPPRQAELFAS